jgi:hypothetical protein
LVIRGRGAGDLHWDDQIEFVGSAEYVPRPSGDTWRELEVVVTPAGVATFLDGTPAVEVQEQRVTAWFTRTPIEIRKRLAAEPALELVRPTYRPRGGLGLCLWNGVASFRSVVVQPLGGTGEK